MKVYWCVENGRCHLGVLAQLAAAAAWTHDVWLCERPCVLFRGEGRCSSSGFKINQSGMWPLGPKGFIHSEERALCSLHFLVILRWIMQFPAHPCSLLSQDEWADMNNHSLVFCFFFYMYLVLPASLSPHTWTFSWDVVRRLPGWLPAWPPQGLHHESSGNHNSDIPL